jgi:hypothetical protein
VRLCLCSGLIERAGSKELQRVFSGNLLCTFSVHSITVTHNVLLSEHTGTDRHSTICYESHYIILYYIILYFVLGLSVVVWVKGFVLGRSVIVWVK